MSTVAKLDSYDASSIPEAKEKLSNLSLSSPLILYKPSVCFPNNIKLPERIDKVTNLNIILRDSDPSIPKDKEKLPKKKLKLQNLNNLPFSISRWEHCNRIQAEEEEEESPHDFPDPEDSDFSQRLAELAVEYYNQHQDEKNKIELVDVKSLDINGKTCFLKFYARDINGH